MVVNGGLFGYAGKAVGDTQKAKEEEEELASGKIKVGDKWYKSLQDVADNKPIPEHSWTREGDTFKCLLHENEEFQMGQGVDLETTKLGTTEYNESKLRSDKENVIYTVTGEEAIWVVLGIEDTDSDGINETLLVTSSKPLWLIYENEEETYEIDIYMKGATAFNNGPDELRRMCEEIYSNSYGKARSMTVEDVNNALNYKPNDGYVEDYDNSIYKYARDMLSDEIKEKIKNGEIPEKKGFDVTIGDLSIWETIEKNKKYYIPEGNGTENKDKLKETIVNGYSYRINSESKIEDFAGVKTNNILTPDEIKVIFGTGWNTGFWLASNGTWAQYRKLRRRRLCLCVFWIVLC